MLAQLRTEAYPVYRGHRYPPAASAPGTHSYERNVRLIDESKRAASVERKKCEDDPPIREPCP